MPKKQTPGPGDGGQPQRRKRGRPPRTPEQLAAAKERRIKPSYKGRLAFRPGDTHTLDVQEREARNYRYLIAAKLAQLQSTLAELDTQDDPSAAISAQEAALKEFLWATYENHKHRDHILATFLAIRRARLLATLEAAGAALEMAADLLRPDDRLLKELQAAVEQQRQAAARQRPPKPTQEGPAEQTAALMRFYGQDKETVQAQLDKFQAEQSQAADDDATERIDHRHIYGDVNTTRQRLARFDDQAREIRAAISPAIGWFEVFYIEKVQISSIARKYLMRGEKPPADVPMFEGIIYGPYLKYRWQEATGGPQYAIQMSLIPAEERASAAQWAAIQGEEDDDEGRAPWPDL